MPAVAGRGYISAMFPNMMIPDNNYNTSYSDDDDDDDDDDE